MQSIFRYSPKEYNDSLTALGNIRIGTLHDFRRSEHRAGISDSMEGKKVVSHHIDSYASAGPKSIHHQALKEFKIIDVGDARNIVVQGITMNMNFDLPDCYIHCTSSSYSTSAMNSLKGSDSCVEIADYMSFYERLTETLSQTIQVDFYGFRAVKYRERSEPWNGIDWGDHPAYIKENEFKDQVEMRAIWVPRSEAPISPIVVNDCKLIQYCRTIDVPR